MFSCQQVIPSASVPFPAAAVQSAARSVTGDVTAVPVVTGDVTAVPVQSAPLAATAGDDL